MGASWSRDTGVWLGLLLRAELVLGSLGLLETHGRVSAEPGAGRVTSSRACSGGSVGPLSAVPSAQPGCHLQWWPGDCAAQFCKGLTWTTGLPQERRAEPLRVLGTVPGVPGSSLHLQMHRLPPSLKAMDRAEGLCQPQAQGPSTGAGSLSRGTPGPHPALVLSSSSGRSICTPSLPGTCCGGDTAGASQPNLEDHQALAARPAQASPSWLVLGQCVSMFSQGSQSCRGQTDLFLDRDVPQCAGLGWRGTEGASDPALGIRGLPEGGGINTGTGAVCCGKRGWGVPERGSSICRGPEVGETGCALQT